MTGQVVADARILNDSALGASVVVSRCSTPELYGLQAEECMAVESEEILAEAALMNATRRLLDTEGAAIVAEAEATFRSDELSDKLVRHVRALRGYAHLPTNTCGQRRAG